MMSHIKIPNREEFLKGLEQFEQHEKRDAMYKVATFLVSYHWGKPSDMADGLGVLLLTWNQAFYRYGIFDFNNLEKCIAATLHKIESFRNRDIFSLSVVDEPQIKDLFLQFLKALQINSGAVRGRKSPVAVAKTLHLLSPAFFPLWDDKIARAYNCYYSNNPAEQYVSFCKITKYMAEKIKPFITRYDKTVTKLIDQFNYSKYTQKWI